MGWSAHRVRPGRGGDEPAERGVRPSAPPHPPVYLSLSLFINGGGCLGCTTVWMLPLGVHTLLHCPLPRLRKSYSHPRRRFLPSSHSFFPSLSLSLAPSATRRHTESERALDKVDSLLAFRQGRVASWTLLAS